MSHDHIGVMLDALMAVPLPETATHTPAATGTTR